VDPPVIQFGAAIGFGYECNPKAIWANGYGADCTGSQGGDRLQRRQLALGSGLGRLNSNKTLDDRSININTFDANYV
jgi:hypothetical protein